MRRVVGRDVKNDMDMAQPARDPGRRQRALVIEPEDMARRSLQLLLEGWKFEVSAFAAPPQTLGSADPNGPGLMCLSHRLPGGDGCSLLQRLRERGWRGDAILIAEVRCRLLIQDAEKAGFMHVLQKPVGRLDLFSAISFGRQR